VSCREPAGDARSADASTPGLEAARSDPTRSALSADPTGSRRGGDDDAEFAAAGWIRWASTPAHPHPVQQLRWSNLLTILAARDEKLVEWFLHGRDPSGGMRNAWLDTEVSGLGGVTEKRSTAIGRPVAGAVGERVRFFLIGDTGDASASQYAVRDAMLRRKRQLGDEVAFAFIASDVVYPAGAEGEYGEKVWDVYRDLGLPLYAVPGNHDWNDGCLAGFMRGFCAAGPIPPTMPFPSRGIARHLWHGRRHGGPAPGQGDVSQPRGVLPQQPQPSPYFALDAGPLLVVGVDPGYGSSIDTAQAKWLIDIVRYHPNRPKLLVTGKPLMVEGERRPGAFADGPLAVAGRVFGSVDDVVREPDHDFVAVIGGDVHNYQRYHTCISRTPTAGEPTQRTRILDYVVSGGGGVFLGQTQDYPLPIAIDEDAGVGDWANDGAGTLTPHAVDHVVCDEKHTILYPRRSHSLLFADRITRAGGRRPSFSFAAAIAVATAVTLVIAVVAAITGLVADRADHESVTVLDAIIAALLVGVPAALVVGRFVGRRAGLIGFLAFGAVPGIVAFLLAELAVGPSVYAQREGYYALLCVASVLFAAGSNIQNRPDAASQRQRTFGRVAVAIALAVVPSLLVAAFAVLRSGWSATWAILAIALLAASTAVAFFNAFPGVVRGAFWNVAPYLLGVAGLVFLVAAREDALGLALATFALGLALGAATILLLARPPQLFPYVTGEQARERLMATAGLTGREPGLSPGQRLGLAVLGLLPKGQRSGSIFAPFAPGEPLLVAPPSVRGDKVNVPFYRHFLEVEAHGERRGSVGEWSSATVTVTCFGVSGDSNEVALPVEDRFTVRWEARPATGGNA
jgi:hypothetical protein